MPSIKAVVFDIGNVLIGWDPEGFYDGVIGEGQRRKLFAEVDLDGMNERVDLGDDFKEAVYAKADEHPEWQDEIRLWHDRWIEMAQPAIEHSAMLLRALRAKGMPVFALSNFGIASFEIAKSVYPVLVEFDRSYISGHMGVIKPDPVIYERLENESGVAPGQLLFADDRLNNVEAALERGWQAHLFTEPKGFADRLVAEGLLSKAEASA